MTMTATSATVALLLNILPAAALANELPLNRLGQPFANPECEIVWAATNKLPESLWTYRVLPSTFSQGVISNLVALGSFRATDKVANLGWPPTDTRSICFSNSKRSLGLYPHLGFIEYRYPSASDNKTTEGVPDEDEARRVGTNYLKLLGLDLSQVSKNVAVTAPETHLFKHDPAFHIITNFYSREVSFGRALDGIDFYNKAEGCRIEFAHHAVVRTIWLSWRNLERDKLRPLAKPTALMDWMRKGKCFWQWWAPEAVGMDSSHFKKVTIKRVTPCYYGEDREESQDWVYPFAYLETVVDMALTIGTVPEGEVHFKPADFTNVFRVSTQLRTNQTIFMCCPILDKNN